MNFWRFYEHTIV